MQPVTFAGEQLAFASSQVEDNPSPRWTELAIYRTVTGKYVLEKIGRSDYIHTADLDSHPARNKPGKGALRYESLADALEDVDESASMDDVDKYFVPCDECQPSLDSDDPVIVEQDMHSVERYEDPEQLLNALYYRKGGTVRSLSNLSRNVLDLAARKDEGIRAIRSRPVEI
jgi:hypothetical protein